MTPYEVRKVLEQHTSLCLDNPEEREKLVSALTAEPEPTAHELKARVERWFREVFSPIPLSMVEQAYSTETDGGNLFEAMEVDDGALYEEFFEQYGEEDEREAFEEDPEHWCSGMDMCGDFDSFRDEYLNACYPMWGTLFQCSHSGVIEACKEHGLTIIRGFGDLDDMVGVAGAGYSFYGAHWIPIWLSLPWNDEGRERYKGINYQGV